jgi:hypothetical protein
MTSSSTGSFTLPSIGLGDDLRLAHRQLVTFAAHHFDQDGELQFAAAHHLEGVVAQFLHADGDVGEQFLVEPVAQIARRHPLALAPAKGDVLMVNAMAMVGSSIWMGGSGLGVSALVTVSPMVMPSTPAMARMSPGRPMVSSTRFRPSNE